ncbi:GNAT family N-acetyltransferase [Kribbella sp. NPDC000426]|uniref:GNAT family N-acetyltransferase n=1 Tax=Kribbella sp. NPDC000426 TaxID=3154255 RepID=UPI0033295B4B
MDIGARIAAAQLTGSARLKRQVIAGPLAGMLHDNDAWYLSGVLAAEPGQPFDPDEIPWAIETIRQAFAAEGRWVHAEFVEEANSGLAEALEAQGMTIVSHLPLLVVEPRELVVPPLPAGTTVQVVSSPEEQSVANAVGAEAYEMDGADFPYKPDAADGGAVVVYVDDVPAATAAWTAVADEVSEVAGVGTIHSHRRRGLGAIATAYATQIAFDLGRATLAWLTPGDDGADRIYRRLGYKPQATAVHLGDPGEHLADLR